MTKYGPLVFDIEGNGLLKTVSKIWMVCITDMRDGREYICCDDAVGSVEYPEALPTDAFREIFDNCESVSGHYVLGYDFPALQKVLRFRLKKSIPVRDTMLMSQVLDYKRFPSEKHSLEAWGEHLGYPKVVHEEWDKYSPEMLHRCITDMRINVRIAKRLSVELVKLAAKRPYIKQSLRAEHDVLRFVTEAEILGWPFDKPAAIKLIDELTAAMKKIEDELVPQLQWEVKLIDDEPKNPVWIKNGNYNSHTARYFDLPPESGKDEIPPIWGPFQRFEYVEPDLGNISSVKSLLDRYGWEPDDWNWKRVGNAFVKGTPKLTTTSLLPIGPVGVAIDTYYTLRSRHQIVSGWIEAVGEDGRLHGECFTIATPTGRARHKGLVNVPSGDGKSLYGVEIRKLFGCTPGYKLIGADSAGNQMRAFCHYLKNDDYTNEVINGDVHTKNRDILREVVADVERGKHAKPFLYAFLFGAGSEKCGLILTGKRDAKIGKRAKEIFGQKVPGLKELTDRITKIYNQTSESNNGKPWIPALDGRRIYIDSPHKALNYLLQSCEAVTCKAATSMCMAKLDEAGIPWNPLIFYHDEIEFEVPEQYAEQAAAIAKLCFKEAPKLYGVEIMDGEAKIGDTWYDVH